MTESLTSRAERAIQEWREQEEYFYIGYVAQQAASLAADLLAEVERLTAETANMKQQRANEIVESDAVFNAAMAALDGESVSEFMASFPLVRRALDAWERGKNHEAAINALVEQIDRTNTAEAALAAAAQEIAALAEKWGQFTIHADGCEAWPQFSGHFQSASHVGKCTCGLGAATAQLSALAARLKGE